MSEKNRHIAAAMAEAAYRTPQEILDAFSAGEIPVEVGGSDIRLRPMGLGHKLLLEKMGSPLVIPMNVEDPDFLDLFRALVVLSHSPAEGRALLSSGQLDPLAETLRDSMLPCQLPSLRDGIAESLRQAFARPIDLVAPPSLRGKKKAAGSGRTSRSSTARVKSTAGR